MEVKLKISIIVPIYKVEKYINHCIYSLTNQTYKNIEIILVEDGSPDNCPQLCDDFAKKDTRIKVIHKSNGGLSDARNFGLKEATGEYVLFVDSDDTIDLDTCERFVLAMDCNGPDIIVGNARRLENKKVYKMEHGSNTIGKVLTGSQYLKEELKVNSMYMAAWLNLYSKEFLINNKLEFKVGLLHEDEQFTPRAFLKAKIVLATNIIFYNYLIRDDSITTAKNKIKNAEHIMQICKEMEEIYKEIKDGELRKLLNDNLVNKFLNTFQVAELHKKEYSYLVDKKFLKDKAYTKRNKSRVRLFMLNKKLYYYTNKINKMIKEM